MIKKLFFLLFLLCAAYSLREAYFYMSVRKTLPVGTTIANVPVAEISLEEASKKVAEAYAQSIILHSDVTNQEIELPPQEFGFQLGLGEMLALAEQKQAEVTWWEGYVSYLVQRPLRPISVELIATHDETKLYDVAQLVGNLVSDPPIEPHIDPKTVTFVKGTAGYSADYDLAAQKVISALYSVTDRKVEYPLIYQEAPSFDMMMLQKVLEKYLTTYSDLVSSIFVKNLQTGEEVSINGDLAISGTSVIKIAIMLEVYRALDNPPNFDQQKLLNETAIRSGNYSANLLLDVVAGEDNAYLGADILTESMHKLGLKNFFIVTPYEEPPRPERSTLVTPANSVPDLVTDPDPNMQATAEDVGILLSMIYDCSRGGGALIALYPDQLTPSECQALIDLMAQDFEGNLVRYGVPHKTVVSHKHGWAGNTHGDAAIVYSPKGDYIIVEYLTQPSTDWLVADYSFPVLREISRIVYNYFNFDQPYLGDPLMEKEREVQPLATEESAESTVQPEGNDQIGNVETTLTPTVEVQTTPEP